MAEANLSCMVNELSELLSDDNGGNWDLLKHLQEELEEILHALRNSNPPEWKGDQMTRSQIVREISDAACDMVRLIDVLRRHESYMARSVFLVSPLRELRAKIDQLKAKLIDRGGSPPAASSCHQPEISFSDLSSSSDRSSSSDHSSSSDFLASSDHSSSSFLSSSSDPSYWEDRVVGRESDKCAVIDMVLLPYKSRIPISILGLGGLGKTVFAREIYNSLEVMVEFQVRAWVSLSREDSKLETLRRLVDAVEASTAGISREMNQEASCAGGDDGPGAMGEEQKLKMRLQELLNPSVKYLIVADDAWAWGQWRDFEEALPDHNNRSRIIVTTRLYGIAKAVCTSIPPYFLLSLSQPESEQLFLKNVYPKKKDPQFPKQLEKVGQMIVRMCRGLPLALIVLGGFLSVKDKSENIWSDLLSELSWEDLDVERIFDDIFSLCYHDLPNELKPCCLLLACFPRDSDINVARLIRLWVAKGFVPNPPPKAQWKTRELMASNFLDELLRRRIIEVVSWRFDGTVKKIRTHNRMRDVLIKIARESSFLCVAVDEVVELASENEGIAIRSGRGMATRSLVLHCSVKSNMESSTYSYLRSLVVFNLQEGVGTLYRFINRLCFLRVLYVEADVELLSLPCEITRLVHLKYLRWISANANPVTLRPSKEFKNVQQTYIKTSVNCQLDDGLNLTSQQETRSSSLKNLCNLEILEVSPLLIGMGSDKNIEDICSLQKLRTLRTIIAARWIEDDLEKMTSLQKLGLCAGTDYLLKSLVSLEKLSDRLVSLTLQSSGSKAIPMARVLSIFGGRCPLRSLKLIGQLSMAMIDKDEMDLLPELLEKLTLENSRLEENPMEMLWRLPELKVLRIREKAFLGKTLCCQQFPKLQFLTLEGLPELEELAVSRLPKIKEVMVLRCPKFGISWPLDGCPSQAI